MVGCVLRDSVAERWGKGDLNERGRFGIGKTANGLPAQTPFHQKLKVLWAGFIPAEAVMKRVVEMVEAERRTATIVRAI